MRGLRRSGLQVKVSNALFCLNYGSMDGVCSYFYKEHSLLNASITKFHKSRVTNEILFTILRNCTLVYLSEWFFMSYSFICIFLEPRVDK